MGWDTYSPYAKHTGQSLGRVLHFVYHYCGSRLGETVTVGHVHSSGAFMIMSGSDPVATYKWNDDVPTFDFFPEGWDSRPGIVYQPYDRRCREYWTQRQTELADKVAYPEEYRREQAAKLQKFVDQLAWLKDTNNLMDTRLANPAKTLVECWAQMINNLPIEQLSRYIQCAKLYEAIKSDKR